MVTTSELLLNSSPDRVLQGPHKLHFQIVQIILNISHGTAGQRLIKPDNLQISSHKSTFTNGVKRAYKLNATFQAMPEWHVIQMNRISLIRIVLIFKRFGGRPFSFYRQGILWETQ